MEQSRAAEIAEPTPIFGAYRRGYDPEQVDRYVAEQQRRLDDAQLRASEAEQKLAAAVSQLRELHRRVGILEEHQQRSAPQVQLDAVGEHIQKMFEEARRGADALRSSAEFELTELRQKTIDEARSIIAGARRKAEELDAEIDRRRREQLDRLEEDRAQATTQLTYLHEQRKNAVAELLRLREVIDSSIAEVSTEARERPASRQERSESGRVPSLRTEIPHPHAPTRDFETRTERSSATSHRPVRPSAAPDPQLFDSPSDRGFETARLVKEHRARVSTSAGVRRVRVPADPRAQRGAGFAVFDYEAQ